MKTLRTLLAPALLLVVLLVAPSPAAYAAEEEPQKQEEAVEPMMAWPLALRDLMLIVEQVQNQFRHACPVDGDHSFIDSWGFPRSGGRRHKGTDIMAARGTDAVAIQAGTIETMGYDRLGGNYIILISWNNNRYYYAHLDAFAEGVSEGQYVASGELIGYVGDTGNARGTPPHIHFEYRPDMGNRVNPYPLLTTICEEAER